MKTSAPNSLDYGCAALFRLCCVFTLLILSTKGGVAQMVYDFNTPGQLAEEFYASNFQGGFGNQSASGGLGNSGWVQNAISGSNRGYEVTEQSFAGLTNTFTLSIYFQWGSQSTGAYAGESLALGIGRSSDADTAFNPKGGNSGYLGPDSLQQLSIGIGPRNQANDVRIYYSSVVDGVNANMNQPGNPVATLTVGNWYYLQVDFSLLDTNDGYTFAVELFNSSNTGVISGTSLLSYSASHVNPDLVGGAGDQVQAYFMGRSVAQGGVVGVDNFQVSAIPEPSAGILGLIGVFLGWMQLRRRSNGSLA